MPDYKKSDYALNHKKEGIVYQFADSIVEISINDFLASSPNLTEEDFWYWKRLSDQMYLFEKRADWRQTHQNITLSSCKHDHALVEESAESFYFSQEEIDEKQSHNDVQVRIARQALSTLSAKQRHRYLLRVAYQFSFSRIASIEGISPQSAFRSIKAAQKRISMFLSELQQNGVIELLISQDK